MLGHARDVGSNNWGLVLRWNDRAGVQHIWCVPVGLAYSAGAELSAAFASQGLSCATSSSGKDKLKNYIARHRPPTLVTAVTQTGWFCRPGARRATVLNLSALRGTTRA